MNDAYQNGYDAFNNHLEATDNPYNTEREQKLWEEGWEDAKMDADHNRRSICSERESDPL